ncbi:MAG: DUF2892 domain-containing protein [Methanotrichaceae archaeon]
MSVALCAENNQNINNKALNNRDLTFQAVKNIGTLDRLLRVFLAEICIIAGFFWVSTDWQILLYLIAALMVFQAATGVCGFYNMLRWNTCERVKRSNKNLIRASLAILIVIAVAGAYTSAVLTKDMLTRDIMDMRNPYNLTLDYTSKGLNKESLSSYQNLSSALAAFNDKYSKYRPLAVKFDDGFTGDMKNLTAIIGISGDDIQMGKLTKAHDKLALAGPIFESMMSRNNLS